MSPSAAWSHARVSPAGARTLSTEFATRYGPWALVAGGSEGLGAAFAEAVASRGLNLVLVALDGDTLERTAEQLAQRHDVEVATLVADLGRPDIVERVENVLDEREVGLLIANAAASPIGPFLDRPLEEHLAAVDVNVTSTIRLVHALAPAMVERRRGGIVLMTSMSGLQGTAHVASYAATKAFDLVLAEGLWHELRPHGVDVLACIGGTIDTPGYRSSNPRGGPKPMAPATVANAALEALGSGPRVVPGAPNRIAATVMSRLLPRRWAIKLTSDATTKMYR